jgi:ribonuclease BN (tRNA processing enzyme)
LPSLTLTILGASPAAPNSGGACSGYLARDGEANALIDCGSGTAGRLAQHLPPNQLRGIAISHLHPDHYFDLVPLYYIIKFGEPRPAHLGARVPLHVPPRGREFFRSLGQLVAAQSDMLDDIFDIQEYAPGPEVSIGGLTFTFHPVQHYVPSHAMRIRGSNGALLTFSSDVAPCPGLVEAARGADVFLCESAILDRSQDRPDPAQRGHMMAGEAGRIAREAGARQLLLTHYRSGNGFDARHREAAEEAFGGRVELVREGKTYPIA